MNVDVKVTLDLSPVFVEMLWNVLVRVPNARLNDLDERIEAAVGRAVQLAGWDRDAAAAAPIVPQPWPAPAPAPAAPTPAKDEASAVQFAPEPEKGPRWTKERHDVLDFYFPAGELHAGILARLNALPGPAVSYEQMNAKIFYRKLKRDVPPSSSPSPQIAAVDIKGVTTEVVTDDATIRHWAGPRGLCNDSAPLDLQRINDKRVELGLARFSIKKSFAAGSAR